MLVLDASMALSWIFPEEYDEEAEVVLDRVTRDGAVVPGLWWLEIANVLLLAETRGRIDDGYTGRSLQRLRSMTITTDADTAQCAWGDTIALARAERLTIYDASYLELAIRMSLPLATRDAALVKAAFRQKVPTA